MEFQYETVTACVRQLMSGIRGKIQNCIRRNSGILDLQLPGESLETAVDSLGESVFKSSKYVCRKSWRIDSPRGNLFQAFASCIGNISAFKENISPILGCQNQVSKFCVKLATCCTAVPRFCLQQINLAVFHETSGLCSHLIFAFLKEIDVCR